jgi:uncharacterized protein (TIGR02246 family)
MRKSLLLVMSALVLVVGFTSSSLAQSQSSTRVAIEAANKQFMAAVAKKDAAALAALYTDEAIVLPQGSEMMKGKAAIKGLFEGMLASGVGGITLTTLEVETSGDAAYEVGLYELKGPDGAVIDKGKSVVIWKKVKGEWKMHRDIFNSNQQPLTR